MAASVHLPAPPGGSRGAGDAEGAAAPVLGWVGARLGGDSECDGPSPICSKPWGLFAVLENSHPAGVDGVEPGGVGDPRAVWDWCLVSK